MKQDFKMVTLKLADIRNHTFDQKNIKFVPSLLSVRPNIVYLICEINWTIGFVTRAQG